jgi:hypothetical protein
LLTRLRDFGRYGLRLVRLRYELRLTGQEAGNLLRDRAFDFGGGLA